MSKLTSTNLQEILSYIFVGNTVGEKYVIEYDLDEKSKCNYTGEIKIG